MKASDLILKLQDIIESHGDLEVFHLSTTNGCNESDDEYHIYEKGPSVKDVKTRIDQNRFRKTVDVYPEFHWNFDREDLEVKKMVMI